MDPEGQHADDRIWAVLEKVQLKAVILEMADTLGRHVMGIQSVHMTDNWPQL